MAVLFKVLLVGICLSIIKSRFVILLQRDTYLELKAKTNEFEEYLETTSRKMYPNILETLYFVPPVYFNKTEGSVQYVADQTVYVYTRPDRQNAIHDQAMQYLILCLRHVGEQKPEEMFVLIKGKVICV